MPAVDTDHMTPTTVSNCGRFVVIDALHVDRSVFEALARWATDHGLGIQDAIQVALCAFNDRTSDAAACDHGEGARILTDILRRRA